jgi:hypothetical protein
MRRSTAIAFMCVVAIPVVIGAQGQEFARVLRDGDRATLSVFGSRPVDIAARQLVKEFGIALNVEDPVYLHGNDVEDRGITRSGKRLLVPTPALLEMPLDLRADGSLADVRQAVSDLRDTANRLFPFEFRIDSEGGTFTLIPTRTRDEHGRSIQVTPLLDRRVTIPLGTRTIVEHVQILTDSIQRQTEVRVSCCQGVVTGIPWGSTVVTFGAHDEIARNVLLRLLRSEPGRDPFVRSDEGTVRSLRRATDREDWRWTLRCQPGQAWCAINVATIPDKPQ